MATAIISGFVFNRYQLSPDFARTNYQARLSLRRVAVTPKSVTAGK